MLFLVRHNKYFAIIAITVWNQYNHYIALLHWKCNIGVANEPLNAVNKIHLLLSESRLSRSAIEKAVRAAKATVDSAYEYSRREWVCKPAKLIQRFEIEHKKYSLSTLWKCSKWRSLDCPHHTGAWIVSGGIQLTLPTSSVWWSSPLDRLGRRRVLQTTWTTQWDWSRGRLRDAQSAPSMPLVCYSCRVSELFLQILTNSMTIYSDSYHALD